jgi:predicted nucleotidyltransferase
MKSTLTTISNEKLRTICEKYGIKKLSIFGSSIHGAANSESDLDILVEFLPDRTPGFAYIDLEDELSALFQKKVDLHTPPSLSRYFRTAVVKEAQMLYAHS